MADDDKIGPNLLSEVTDFFGWLTSYQFGHGIEAQFFQSGNAFIEYLNEVIFHTNRCPGEGYLGQQKSTVFSENR